MDLLKGSGLTGLIVGIGVVLLSPILPPVVREVIRPAAKAVIRSGLVLYEQGRVAVAEVGEMAEDVYAEARAELEEAERAVSEITTGEGRPARRRTAAKRARAKT
jgi:Protein of unknown function (DUF5132)